MAILACGGSACVGVEADAGRMPEPGGWNRFVLPVSDIAAVVTTLPAQGVQFRNDIVEGPGGRQILCEDPSGSVVELFEAAAASN